MVLREMIKQTECYKVMLNQQSIANQKVLQQQTESFKGIVSEFLVSINESMDTKCNTVSSEMVNLDQEFEKLKEPNIKLVKRVKDLESNQGTTSIDIDKLKDDVDEVESYCRRMRTNTGERSYTCNQFDKAFSSTRYLKIHIRTHTKKKP